MVGQGKVEGTMPIDAATIAQLEKELLPVAEDLERTVG
jgi:hypothetical protein